MCPVLLLSSADHGSLASPAPDGSSVAADSLEVLYPAVFHEILHHLLTKETVIAGDCTNAHSRKAFDPFAPTAADKENQLDYLAAFLHYSAMMHG